MTVLGCNYISSVDERANSAALYPLHSYIPTAKSFIKLLIIGSIEVLRFDMQIQLTSVITRSAMALALPIKLR